METDINSKKQKNLWWIPVVSGVFYLIFGTWLIKAPIGSFKTLTVIFGIFILASGIFETYFALKNKNSLYDQKNYIWGGILSAILGMLLISNPKAILITISMIISAALIFRGATNLYRSFNLKKQNNILWKRPLTSGIILILIAVALLWHPEIIGFTVAIWTAIAFIILGTFRIYLGYKLKTATQVL